MQVPFLRFFFFFFFKTSVFSFEYATPLAKTVYMLTINLGELVVKIEHRISGSTSHL